jgi:hypothetical protein
MIPRLTNLSRTAFPTDLSEATPSQWATLHSFLGRLLGAGLVQWWDFAMWALEDALDADRALECDVLAAVETIKHVGPDLFAACCDGEQPALTLEKWEDWMLKFGAVQADGAAKCAAIEAQIDMAGLLHEHRMAEMRAQAEMERSKVEVQA